NYLHHVLLWKRTDLWTTFDRLGFKRPNNTESAGLPLHVDQNPRIHPNFRTIQGVLALRDCPLEVGTFLAVPGSKAVFSEYAHWSQPDQQYVPLPERDEDIIAKLRAGQQPLPLRGGSL